MNYCPRCGTPKEGHRRRKKLVRMEDGSLTRELFRECPVMVSDHEDDMVVRADWKTAMENVETAKRMPKKLVTTG